MVQKKDCTNGFLTAEPVLECHHDSSTDAKKNHFLAALPDTKWERVCRRLELSRCRPSELGRICRVFKKKVGMHYLAMNRQTDSQVNGKIGTDVIESMINL